MNAVAAVRIAIAGTLELMAQDYRGAAKSAVWELQASVQNDMPLAADERVLILEALAMISQCLSSSGDHRRGIWLLGRLATQIREMVEATHSD